MLLEKLGSGNEGSAYFAIPRDALPPRDLRSPEKLLSLLEVVKIRHEKGSTSDDTREIRVMQSETYKAMGTKYLPQLRKIDPKFIWFSATYAGVSLLSFEDYLFEHPREQFSPALSWQLLKELLKILAWLASGVDFEVRKGLKRPSETHRAVTHRDLILENVCVRPREGGITCSIIDFGWGQEHEFCVDDSDGGSFSILQARHDVARVAEIVHFFVHKDLIGEFPHSKTQSYCHCFERKEKPQVPRSWEMIKFLDRIAGENDPEQLTAQQALAILDEPGFIEDRCRPLRKLPDNWNRTFFENLPNGRNIMRIIALKEDINSGHVEHIMNDPKDESKGYRLMRHLSSIDGESRYIHVSEVCPTVAPGKFVPKRPMPPAKSTGPAMLPTPRATPTKAKPPVGKLTVSPLKITKAEIAKVADSDVQGVPTMAKRMPSLKTGSKEVLTPMTVKQFWEEGTAKVTTTTDNATATTIQPLKPKKRKPSKSPSPILGRWTPDGAAVKACRPKVPTKRMKCDPATFEDKVKYEVDLYEATDAIDRFTF